MKDVLKQDLIFFWGAPVVDDPFSSNSLTHEIYSLTNLPSFNTGGNVGTAAWVFAKSILEIENVAVIGMDLGYYKDTPFNMTQTYYELENSLEKDEKIEDYFINFKFPRTQEVFYTDPTYYWYRTNLLAMLDENNLKIKNCTGGGTLFGKNVILANIETFLKN